MTWSPQLIDLTRPMTHETIVGLGRQVRRTGVAVLRYRVHVSAQLGHGATGASVSGRSTTTSGPISTRRSTSSPTPRGRRRRDRSPDRRGRRDRLLVRQRPRNHREDFEQARPRVKPGDIVLIYSAEQPATSMDDYIRNQTFVTPDGAEWLVKQQIKSVGRRAVRVRASVRWHLRPQVVRQVDPATALAGPHDLLAGERLHPRGSRQSRERSSEGECASRRCRCRFPDSSGSPVRAVAWEED